jgi:hypothetical protein
MTARSSALGWPIGVDPARNLTVREASRRLQAGYGPALRRLPRGLQVFRGLPFDLGSRSIAPRWVLVDAPMTIELRGDGAASHVVVAHLCDTRRCAAGCPRRPADLDGRASGPGAGHDRDLVLSRTISSGVRSRPSGREPVRIALTSDAAASRPISPDGVATVVRRGLEIAA